MTTPLEQLGLRALHVDRVGDVLRVAIDHPTSALNAVDALLHEELARLFHVGSQYKKFHAFLKNNGCHVNREAYTSNGD